MSQRWLLQALCIIGFCLYLSPGYALERIASAVPSKGALCVIKADNKIVLINEIITQKLSVPGGTVQTGEDPKLAAQRETWQETGIAVTVGNQLGQTKRAIVYDCMTTSQILTYQHQNKVGGYELPVWFAPDYGVEVSSATLINPDFLAAELYRFPDDWSLVKEMFSQATNQNINMVADLIHTAPPFHQEELKWILAFQQWISQLPGQWKQMIHQVFLIGNMLASPICGIILFPLLYWRCGKCVCYKVCFAISITSLTCLFAQQGFSLPRPHVYFPTLQLVSSYGYGFPSLPIAVWSSIGILLMTENNNLGGKGFVLAYFISAIWLTLSKFYLGSAFIADMAAGGFIGLLITWNIIRFDIKRTERARTVMGSRRVWWGLTSVAAVLTYYWQLPVFGAWLIVLVVMAVVTSSMRNQREFITSLQAVIFTLILAAIYLGMTHYAELDSSGGVWFLLLTTIRYPIIIIMFVLMVKFTRSVDKTL